jgi:chromosomal replication initiator protein
MSTLWDQTLAQLQTALPSQEFTAWISCLRTSSDVSDTLCVEAPSTFHRNWIQRHFLERIRVAVESVAGKPVPVVLAVAAGAAAVPARSPAAIRAPIGAPSIGAQALVFETFVVGPCNELAHAAATTVSQAPGTQYNPLFIHGGVGLGKTHLIHATANALRAGFRGARVLAIGAELFVNEMVSAVRRQQMETFHQRFRRIDTLLVDDVQFIAGKERTQEEFLHTFNLLCAAGKQIVVSSDKPPRAIPNLEAGLRSRFEGGMIAEVTAPDRATRARILERKAALAGLAVTVAVLEYLADRIRASSVRELEGALTRLRAVATMSGRPVDLELAEEVIGPMYPDARQRASEGRIEELVAAAVGVDVRALASGRDVRVVFARQVAMYLMRKHMGLSFGSIGERYGRDHTTVLHAARAIETRRGCDPEIRRLVSALEEKM